MDYITITDFSKKHNISRVYTYALIAKGKLTTKRFGDRSLIVLDKKGRDYKPVKAIKIKGLKSA